MTIKRNIFGDEIALVEKHDFSRANISKESRLEAITRVASICYANPKAIGSESLYNRLLAESTGLPSSAFEFVPILIPMRIRDTNEIRHDTLIDVISNIDEAESKIFTHGERVVHNEQLYLLTNLRALIYDIEALKLPIEYIDNFYNTEEECDIIAQHFSVFRYKIDLPTRSQMVRHRVSWQELSRRYVSGERVPFDFYISEKMKNVVSSESLSSCVVLPKAEGYFTFIGEDKELEDVIIARNTEDIINVCLRHYEQAIADGVKPQEARRIIPQAAYTEIWGAFMPSQLENFYKLRLDTHAQWEIQQVALAMKELKDEFVQINKR